VYFCPLCGASAAPDYWWTQEQIAFIQEAGAGHVFREVSDILENAFRGSRGITYRRDSSDEPEPPSALQEPNDMIIVAPRVIPGNRLRYPKSLSAECIA